MSVKLSPYDTTALSGHVIEPIQTAIVQAYSMGELKPDTELLETPGVVIVRGGSYQDQNIMQFAHPMPFHTRGGWVVAVDARPYGKFEPSQGEFHVRDKWGYQTQLVRAALQEMWSNGEQQAIKTFSRFPMQIYANWVGEMVGKRLGMEMGDQARLTILAGILYQNLFIGDLAPSIDPILLAQSLVAATGMRSELVMEVVDKYPVVEDVYDYCRGAIKVTENVRVNNLNASILLQSAGGYWYGANARETIAVALEHPPTWIALMWQALADHGMRNSALTKILDRGSYRNAGQLFQKQVLNIVKTV